MTASYNLHKVITKSSKNAFQRFCFIIASINAVKLV